jgi:hypothetical protein
MKGMTGNGKVGGNMNHSSLSFSFSSSFSLVCCHSHCPSHRHRRAPLLFAGRFALGSTSFVFGLCHCNMPSLSCE